MPFLPSPTVGQTRFSKTIAITKRYFFIFLRQDIFRFYSQNMDFCFFMFTTSHDGCQYLPMPGGNLRPIAQTGRRIFGRSGRSFLPVLPSASVRLQAGCAGLPPVGQTGPAAAAARKRYPVRRPGRIPCGPAGRPAPPSAAASQMQPAPRRHTAVLSGTWMRLLSGSPALHGR